MASKQEMENKIVRKEGNLDKNLSGSYASLGHVSAPRFMAGLPIYMANTSEESQAPIKNSYFEAMCFLNDIIHIENNRALQKTMYRCCVCQIHLNHFTIVECHIREKRHIQLLKAYKERISLLLLPKPPNNILSVLEDNLNDIVHKLEINESDCADRNSCSMKFDNIVKHLQPGATIKLYGPSITRFGFKYSPIDLNLITNEDSGPGTMFKLFEKLSKDPDIRDLKLDLGNENPRIKFVEISTKNIYEIALNNKKGHHLSKVLSEYSVIDTRVSKLVVLFQYLSKITGIDRAEIGMLPINASELIVIYFLQQLSEPVLPILNISTRNDSIRVCKNTAFTSKNSLTLSDLWLGLLKFYALQFVMPENIISINKADQIQRKVCTQSPIFIEDPVETGHNIAKTVANQISYSYIMFCLQSAYKYFTIPQTIYGPIFNQVFEDTQAYYYNPVLQTTLDSCKMIVERILTYDPRFGQMDNNVKTNSSFEEKCSSLCISTKLAYTMSNRLNPQYVKYSFSQNNFTHGKEPPVVCTGCHIEGHKNDDCPEEELVPILKLPAMSEKYIKQLTVFCKYMEGKLKMEEAEVEQRMKLIDDLAYYISELFIGSKLIPFGSFCNGFGQRNSDLDFSLRLNEDDSSEDKVDIINKLVRHLKKSTRYINIIPITGAKVPIVKFTDIVYNVDGDISVCNISAENNTNLLKTYSEVDSRLKTLASVMKQFMKECDICDASNGSLSSYACVLMVIYFLQQCEPPVLPVLQEIIVGENPKMPNPDCDFYYFDDIKNLENIWPYYNHNNANVGKLWFDLLCFYSTFEFSTYVISIRKKEPLLKFEKQWSTRFIAIEDPFELNHNLGAAISKKMYIFILNAIRKARIHFGNAVDSRINNKSEEELEEFFMKAKYFTRRSAPLNRTCRHCKKGGHSYSQCYQRKMENLNLMKQNESNFVPEMKVNTKPNVD